MRLKRKESVLYLLQISKQNNSKRGLRINNIDSKVEKRKNMTKKIFGIIIIAVVAIVAGLNYQQGKTDVKLSDLALANVEALADGEVIIGVPCAQVCQNCWCIYFSPYEEVEGQPYF